MSRGTSLMILGALVALTPFIGLPYSWLMVILPILGLLVLVLGYARLKRSQLSSDAGYEAPTV